MLIEACACSFALLSAVPATADVLASTPAASAIPEGVRAMIDKAIAGGDTKVAAAVLALAREAHPEAAGEVDAIEAAWRAGLAEEKARREQEARRRLASAPRFDNWKGQVEFGASRSTGNTSNRGIYGGPSAEGGSAEGGPETRRVGKECV